MFQSAFPYTVEYSMRRTLTLQVLPGGKLLVKAPLSTPEKYIQNFVESKKKWIENSKKKMLSRKQFPEDPEAVRSLTEKAKEILPAKVAFYSKNMDMYPKRIRIGRAKTVLGSCSSKGTICFSCYLMLYPDEAIDYVVVHELAHLRYMNHQKNFYNLVASVLPDFKERKKLL